MEHQTETVTLGEGVAQAVCTCGWRSERFGSDKRSGTMDALEQAREAADLHEWDATFT